MAARAREQRDQGPLCGAQQMIRAPKLTLIRAPAEHPFTSARTRLLGGSKRWLEG
jgi:hypothetical protein